MSLIQHEVDININHSVHIPSLRAPSRHRRRRSLKPLILLLQLDAAVRPGITESDFRSVFTRCDVCGLIMTRSASGAHYCANNPTVTNDEAEITDSDSD
jgi:hypothetical protein